MGVAWLITIETPPLFRLFVCLFGLQVARGDGTHGDGVHFPVVRPALVLRDGVVLEVRVLYYLLLRLSASAHSKC